MKLVAGVPDALAARPSDPRQRLRGKRAVMTTWSKTGTTKVQSFQQGSVGRGGQRHHARLDPPTERPQGHAHPVEVSAPPAVFVDPHAELSGDPGQPQLRRAGSTIPTSGSWMAPRYVGVDLGLRPVGIPPFDSSAP